MPREKGRKNLRERSVDLIQIAVYAVFFWPLRYLFRVRVDGLDRISVTKPCLIISNHQSMWDAFIVLSAFGMRNFLAARPLRAPSDNALYLNPLIRPFADMIGLYEIRPQGDLDKSLESTFAQIDAGNTVFFFPEARMVRNGGVGEPKRGIGWIAAHRDVTMQPARIFSDRHDTRGLGSPWRARVVFGSPIPSKDLRAVIPAERLHIEIMRRITELSDVRIVSGDRRKHFSTQVVDAFQEEYLRDLLAIEAQAFAEHPYEDASEYYRAFLTDKRNLVVFLLHGGVRVGQILLRPHDVARADIGADDPLMGSDPERYYVESVAILPEYRGSYGFLDLAYKAIEQSSRRGYRKFSMHIRKTRGLSRAFQRLFGRDITLIRTIDRWKWMNDEPYDYIEATNTRSLTALRRLIILAKLAQVTRRIFRKKRK